jgi:hypothetical protein
MAIPAMPEHGQDARGTKVVAQTATFAVCGSSCRSTTNLNDREMPSDSEA